MKELIDSLTLTQIENMLDTLERRAIISSQPAQRARTFNLAGDVCFDAGQPERGLSYYDRAITTYTTTGQYDSAAKICEKIVALWPQAVRAYWTLAWLSLKRGHAETARQRIEQYVLAAERQGLARVACPYLVELADLAERLDVLESIANGLMQLNDDEAANAVYGRMHKD